MAKKEKQDKKQSQEDKDKHYLDLKSGMEIKNGFKFEKRAQFFMLYSPLVAFMGLENATFLTALINHRNHLLATHQIKDKNNPIFYTRIDIEKKYGVSAYKQRDEKEKKKVKRVGIVKKLSRCGLITTCSKTFRNQNTLKINDVGCFVFAYTARFLQKIGLEDNVQDLFNWIQDNKEVFIWVRKEIRRLQEAYGDKTFCELSRDSIEQDISEDAIDDIHKFIRIMFRKAGILLPQFATEIINDFDEVDDFDEPEDSAEWISELARKLKNIIDEKGESHLRKKHAIDAWADQIRAVHTEQAVELDIIEKVIEWLDENINETYTAKIRKLTDFFKVFNSLENEAMKFWKELTDEYDDE